MISLRFASKTLVMLAILTSFWHINAGSPHPWLTVALAPILGAAALLDAR